MLDVGYKNYIDPTKIKAILSPYSSRAKWLKKEAIEGRTLIDCTQGRKTNIMIVMITDHLVLSSLRYASLLRRLKAFHSKNIYLNNNINKRLLKAFEKNEVDGNS
ncbi:MAG: DUF370 domain-containing protein [Spirochaetes bacterium]|nr:DUF370 domain-containing protein [Spirochaetota bacterium]